MLLEIIFGKSMEGRLMIKFVQQSLGSIINKSRNGRYSFVGYRHKRHAKLAFTRDELDSPERDVARFAIYTELHFKDQTDFK